MLDMSKHSKNEAMKRLESNEELMKVMKELHEKNGAIKGVITKDFKVPVQNGKVYYKLDTITTFWINVQGVFKITKPLDGIWCITIKDGKNIIFKKNGIKANEEISFSYKTGFLVNIELELLWSKNENTTLIGEIKASY